MQAIGVLKAAEKLGLEVPKDLSVSGFDGIEASEFMEITTVQQPLQEMGKLAIEKLLKKLTKSTILPELIRLDTHLVHRRTTGIAPDFSNLKKF